MSTRPRSSLLGAAGLVLLAVFGPWIGGPAEPPSIAPSAVQLATPGTKVQEARLAGGGFVRGREIRADGDGLRLLGAESWRTISGVRLEGPVRSRRLWLGTDHQGRSLLARTLHGARTSLLVAAIATGIALVLGTSAGLASARAAGFTRGLIGIGTDGLLGLPRLLLLLMLGVLLRGSIPGTALAIGLGSWMEVARLVEAESKRLSGLPFVDAVRGSGAGRVRIAVQHLLPNLVPILVVAAPLVATEAVLLEATLSYLGLSGGSDASWGRIVADGQRLLPGGWWIVVFPGLLLCATAFTVHGLARTRDRDRFHLSSS